MKKYFWSLLIVSLLSGCASGVKLNDVPIEDKSGAQVNSPQGNSPQGNSPQGNSPQGNSPQGNSPQGNSPQGKDTDKAAKSATGASSANSNSSSSSPSSASSTSNNPSTSGNSGATRSSNSADGRSSANNNSAVTAPAGANTGSLAGPANAANVIYFDFDSYTVKPEYQSVIEAHAQFLKSNMRARVSLAGHTDERGSREYNLALGQKRGDAVRQSLTLLGVNAAQIESVSFGEEKPAVAGSDEVAYDKNRRTEFFYK